MYFIGQHYVTTNIIITYFTNFVTLLKKWHIISHKNYFKEVFNMPDERNCGCGCGCNNDMGGFFGGCGNDCSILFFIIVFLLLFTNCGCGCGRGCGCN